METQSQIRPCCASSFATASTWANRRADAAEQRYHAAVEFEDHLADDLAPHIVEMIEQLLAIAAPELAGGIDRGV